MKYLGSITHQKDVTTKEYVDGNGGLYKFEFQPTATGNYNIRVYYDIPLGDYSVEELLRTTACFYRTVADGVLIAQEAFYRQVQPYTSNGVDYYRFVFTFPGGNFPYGGTTYYASVETGTTVVVCSSINVEGTLTVSVGM